VFRYSSVCLVTVLLTGWHRSLDSHFLFFEKHRAALRFIQPRLYTASKDVSKGSESGGVKQTAHLHLVPRVRAPAEGNIIKTLRMVGLRYLLEKKQMQIFSALFLSVFSSTSLSARKNFKMDVTLSRKFTSVFQWSWLIQASFGRNTIKIAENLQAYLYMLPVASRG